MSSRLVRKNHLLKNKILDRYPNFGKFQTSIPDFSIVRRNELSDFERYLYKPMMILQLQGSKCSFLGASEHRYGANQYMVSTVTVSALSKITEASPEKPFLALALELDYRTIIQLLSIDDSFKIPKMPDTTGHLWYVWDTDLLLLDAFLRLTLLWEQPPHKQRVLGDMIKREIHYLLLTSSAGEQMQAIATTGTHYNKIAEAVNIIEQNYKEKLYVEDIANKVKIAPSSFFRCFKKITTLSPIQYQKQLRLCEAQRLMLSEGYDAQGACYAVGYESPTQFNREYKKLFGISPRASLKKILRK